VKDPSRRPLCPSGFVTTRSTLPALRAGTAAVIEVALATVTEPAAAPPRVTVAPDTKPVPKIVTIVPPPVGPEPGDTAVTAGGARTGTS
jgi:hypothetical protein